MEPLRQALVERGYMVAGIQGKAAFDREMDFLKKEKSDFRVGQIYRWNQKISFNKETIVGNPAVTEPAFAPVQSPVPTPEPAVDLADAAKLFKNKDRRADGEDNKDNKNQKGVKL